MRMMFAVFFCEIGMFNVCCELGKEKYMVVI